MKKKRKGLKPSFGDSQDTFLKYLGNVDDQDRIIENRNTQCVANGVKWHPYIMGRGDSRLCINQFYVTLKDLKYKADTFLSALDLCIKIFAVLKIPYPPESKAVWVFINKVFYNADVAQLMSSRIFEHCNDLNLNFK